MTTIKPPINIRKIEAEDTVPLRHAVLRPHQERSAAQYPLDAHEDTFHVGAFAADRIIGVASIFHESSDGRLAAGHWRVRGMAVDPQFRARGVGRRLLEPCVAHARAHQGSLIWCNARTTAASFYERCDFVQDGPDFDLPPLGPHRIMNLPLDGEP